MPLRVLTLNLWNNSGPYAERKRRVASWIERLQPDLIGFQEALAGPGIDEVAEILGGMAYYTDFVQVVPFWNDARIAFGNAIASRWPVLDREERRLPDAGDDEHRAALSSTIAAPFGPICFTVTHLNWKLFHSWVRERQVVALAELVRERRPRAGFPPLLVGDFNAQPESSEIRYMCGLQSLEGGSVHFVDVFAAAGKGDGTTWSSQNRFAQTAFEPDRRIDYVFAGPPGRDGIGRVLSCEVVCNDEVSGVWPSDHFGVFAQFATDPLI